MFEQYTEPARLALFHARLAASELGGSEVEAEHLLLGLMCDAGELLAPIFAPAHLTMDAVIAEARRRSPAREPVPTSVEMPFSRGLVRILDVAAEESERLRHGHIGTEHLLLGLLADTGSLAGSLLRVNGIELEDVRKHIIRRTESPGRLRGADVFDQPLATIVAAVIALAGTLVGILAASRRGSRERREARGSRFSAEQHEIYRVLWDRVERINVALRRARVDEGGFATLVADLNEYMLRNGAHVDDADRTLVNQYIRAVKRVHAAVAGAGAEARGSYEATDTIPPEVLERAEELGRAQADADRLREELRTRVRAVLTGTAG